MAELQVVDVNKKVLETRHLSQFRESHNNKFGFDQFKYGKRNNGILHFDEYDEYGERDKNMYSILNNTDFEKMDDLLKEMPPIQIIDEFLDEKSQIRFNRFMSKRNGLNSLGKPSEFVGFASKGSPRAGRKDSALTSRALGGFASTTPRILSEYKEEEQSYEAKVADKKKEKFYNICSETYHIIQWIKEMKDKYKDQSVYFVLVTYCDY